MDITIIIPVYNEEKNIDLLYSRLSKVCQGITTSYELLFVNDGSADSSLDMLKQLSLADPHIRYISFSRNFGHQIAVTAGIDHAEGDAIVIIDADLQDPPELISEMYHKLRSGYEVVYAKRRSRSGESFMKKLTAKLFYRILKSITAINIPVDTGDFRIMDRKITDTLKKMPEQHKYLRGQISWIGYRQGFVEYDRSERHGGVTGYTYRKMLKFALDGITSFSDFPLKFATISGFIVSGFAFFLIIYAVLAKIYDPDYQQGWASTIIAILFIGGIQLIGIGIIREYVSRISDNVKQRPLYIIGESDVDYRRKNV
ncbi:glycosyltransferase family 2 protein [soil metagenome]